jgi:hypothetical protein
MIITPLLKCLGRSGNYRISGGDGPKIKKPAILAGWDELLYSFNLPTYLETTGRTGS